MNYIDIVYNDTANAKGISTVLFVSGCTNNCPECHNPQSHDFKAGYEYTSEVEDKIVESLKKPYIKNLVISGGDPCHSNNIDTIKMLVERVHRETDVRVIIYTGYNLDKEVSLMKKLCSMLNENDLIIDGPYEKDLKTEIRDYRGSTNQRALIINKCDNKITILNNYFIEDLNK